MDAADQVLVVGQVARDLVLRVDEVPGERGAVPARERLEMLGGKGANQAVALAQLGVPVALLGSSGTTPWPTTWWRGPARTASTCRRSCGGRGRAPG